MSLPHISQFVLWGFLGVVFGVAVSLWFVVSVSAAAAVLAVCAGAFCVGFGRKAGTVALLVVVFSLGAFCGIFRSDAYQKQFISQGQVWNMSEGFSGAVEVVSVPRHGQRHMSVYAVTPEDQKMLVRFPRHSNIGHGSIVEISCRLSVPEKFNNFDYPRFLLMHGVQYICTVDDYTMMGSQDNMLVEISQIRERLEHVVNRLIPAPEAGLANGLIFGGDDRLSEQMQEMFARTGMSHIVAVSGYNVTIIIAFVTWLGILCGLWRKQVAILSVVAIIFFVAMIGFPSSGVRAAIMGTLVLFALMYGRAAHAGPAIALAAGSMLLWSPMQLRYDVGFQLSFLALIGIMSAFPLFEKYLIKQHKAFSLTDIIFLTISAQIFVIPVIAYHFGTIAPGSILVNLLVLPILPFTMLFVFLAAITGAVSLIVAAPFAWAAYGLLAYEVWIIRFFADQEWVSREIEHIPFIGWLMYYMCITVVMIYFYKKQRDD